MDYAPRGICRGARLFLSEITEFITKQFPDACSVNRFAMEYPQPPYGKKIPGKFIFPGFLFYLVTVTFLRARGESGERPFPQLVLQASICTASAKKKTVCASLSPPGISTTCAARSL